MTGDLDWSAATDYFGDDIDVHRRHLSRGGRATYGLLACRFLPGDSAHVFSSRGEHAEQQLLQSSLWAEELPQALAARHPGHAPLLVLLALNRSPCGDCAHLLASALNQLTYSFALAAERSHFVLASLGDYHSDKPVQHSPQGHPQTFSTDRGMRALQEAGWRLCTLTFDGERTRRGQTLAAYLQTLPRHG